MQVPASKSPFDEIGLGDDNSLIKEIENRRENMSHKKTPFDAIEDSNEGDVDL